MKHIRIIALLLVVTLLFVGLLSCTNSKEATEEDFTGTWNAVEYEGEEYRYFNTLALYNNGRGYWNGRSITWSFHNKELIIIGPDGNAPFYYSFQGNRLKLTHKDSNSYPGYVVFEKE